MTQIVFLDKAGLAPQISIPGITLNNGQKVEWLEYETTTPEQVSQRLVNATVAIVNKVVIDAQVLSACPNLQHIAVSATGYNNVDLDACRKHNVSVSNIPAYATTSVPEHALMLMLTLRRQLLSYRKQVHAGEWATSNVFCLFGEPIKDLRDSTLGIIGYGDIGQATANLARALGMRVVYSARSKKVDSPDQMLPLNDVLKTSDIVSLHCSLNASTQDLIGAEQIELMQPNALLINTARGGIVNEKALAQAIVENRIAGIGIDVLEQEPPRASSPLLALSDRPNVVITPHIAWASDQAMQLLANTLANNVIAFLEGQPKNIVN